MVLFGAIVKEPKLHGAHLVVFIALDVGVRGVVFEKEPIMSILESSFEYLKSHKSNVVNICRRGSS